MDLFNQSMFGIKDAPKFIKMKARTDEEVKEMMEVLFGNKEDKDNVNK